MKEKGWQYFGIPESEVVPRSETFASKKSGEKREIFHHDRFQMLNFKCFYIKFLFFMQFLQKKLQNVIIEPLLEEHGTPFCLA